MSTTYGPIIFPATGQILTVDISQETAAMIVENQSLNDVLFSVAAATPQVVTQASAAASIAAGLPITNGGWDLHVGPRQAGILQIPDSSKTDTPHGRYWTGTVWIQQVQITNALVTAGSFVSNPGANCWVTAYGPGEKIPDAGLTSVGYFLASQERQISVPTVPFICTTVTVTPSAINTWTNYPISTFLPSLNIGNLPFSNSAITNGLASAGFIYVLIYYIFMSMQPLSAGAAVGEGQAVSLRNLILDSSSAVVGGSTIVLFSCYLEHLSFQGGNNQASFMPGGPMAVQLPVSAGTGPPYSMQPQLICGSPALGGGGTLVKPVLLNIGMDIATALPFGPSGGVLGLASGSVYNGFVF